MPTSKALRLTMLVCALLVASRDARAQLIVDPILSAYFNSTSAVVNNIPNNANIAAGINFGAFDVPSALSSALVVETAGFPIGSSSGGFTYFFDATSGAAVRSSPSFGPAFAERPLTSGRGKLNVGFTYLHRNFSQIEGKDLDDGSLKLNTELFFTSSFQNADLIESTFRLKLKSDTATFFATYGLLNRLDLAVAVPVQHVSIEATVHSELVRFGPTSQALPVKAADDTQSSDGKGIGDVAVRAKYSLINSGRGALAAGIDLRLPSGDEKKLLGTGNTRTKIYVAAASKSARIFPHVNFGYTFKSHIEDTEFGPSCTGGSEFCFGSELNYVGGAEFVVNPRLTVVGDLVGRSLAKEGRLKEESVSYRLTEVVATNTAVTPPRVTTIPAETKTVTELVFHAGERLNSTLAAIGAKFSPASTFVISGHVLVQLTDAGIKSKVTPVIGVDYTF